jgi:potassium-dependent mechanosensitive channel
MTGLGDSALNFELRVFIATREQHPALVHSLNTMIAKKFQEQGIEIAFPQRDLHIRSVSGLPAMLSASDGGTQKKKDKSAA